MLVAAFFTAELFLGPPAPPGPAFVVVLLVAFTLFPAVDDFFAVPLFAGAFFVEAFFAEAFFAVVDRVAGAFFAVVARFVGAFLAVPDLVAGAFFAVLGLFGVAFLAVAARVAVPDRFVVAFFAVVDRLEAVFFDDAAFFVRALVTRRLVLVAARRVAAALTGPASRTESCSTVSAMLRPPRVPQRDHRCGWCRKDRSAAGDQQSHTPLRCTTDPERPGRGGTR